MMKARDIGRDMVINYVADPVEARVKLARLIRGEISTLQETPESVTSIEKAKVVETLASFWVSEMLEQTEIHNLLAAQHADDGYNPLFWVLWPGFIKRPVDGWTPDVDDLNRTIRVMFEIGWSPLDRNKKGENVVQSMKLAKKSGFLPDIDCDALYDALMHPTLKVLQSVCNSAINKCTLRTVESFINPVRWVISQSGGMKLFASSMFASALKTYHGAKQNGFYVPVHNMMEIARCILSCTRVPADETFDRFFRQHPWSIGKMVTEFRTLLIQQCFETTFTSSAESDEIVASNSFGSFSSTQFALDAIGAIIGEVGSDADKNSYMEMCLDGGEHLLMHFTVCFVHAARQNTSDWMKRFDQTLNALRRNVNKINSFSVFMILGAIERHYGRRLISMADLFPELRDHQLPSKSVVSEPVKVEDDVEEWEDDVEDEDDGDGDKFILDERLYGAAPNISKFLRVTLPTDFRIAVKNGELNVVEGDNALCSLACFIGKNQTQTEDAYIAFICKTAELVLSEEDFPRVNIIVQETVFQTRSETQYRAALAKLQACNFSSLVDCGAVGRKLIPALVDMS